MTTTTKSGRERNSHYRLYEIVPKIIIANAVTHFIVVYTANALGLKVPLLLPTVVHVLRLRPAGTEFCVESRGSGKIDSTWVFCFGGKQQFLCLPLLISMVNKVHGPKDYNPRNNLHHYHLVSFLLNYQSILRSQHQL